MNIMFISPPPWGTRVVGPSCYIAPPTDADQPASGESERDEIERQQSYNCEDCGSAPLIRAQSRQIW